MYCQTTRKISALSKSIYLSWCRRNGNDEFSFRGTYLSRRCAVKNLHNFLMKMTIENYNN